MIRKLRLGQFELAGVFMDTLCGAETEEEYREAREVLGVLFRDMVVVETEFHYTSNRFVYTALCETLFDEVEQGEEIPFYQITMHREEDGRVRLEAVRMKEVHSGVGFLPHEDGCLEEALMEAAAKAAKQGRLDS